MSLESVKGPVVPPRVAGEVNIARFLSSSDRCDRWRVSIDGRVHFLTDKGAAQRIYALSSKANYAQAYECYVGLAGSDAESLGAFVAWSERYRDKLERLAETPDGHPLKFRCCLLGEAACQHIGRYLAWLFYPLPAITMMLASAALFGSYAVSLSPSWQGAFWLAMPLAFLGIFVHEMGHIAACVRHGARQGGIGVGLYWIGIRP